MAVVLFHVWCTKYLCKSRAKTCRGECSHECAHGLWEVANFKTFHSLRAELANLIETRRVYYFSTDSTTVGSKCFASEAYHSRSILCGWQYWQIEKPVKENVLINMPTGCEKSWISKHFTHCELNLRTWSRPGEFNYFSTDSTAVGSNCFTSEAYHSRSVLCGWQYWQKSKRTHFLSAIIHVEAKMPL